jgi:MG2 domain-containing protein
MSRLDKRKNRIVATLGLALAVTLFLATAATSALSFSNMAAFAQPSNLSPFKGNVTGAIISEPGSEKEKADAGANNNASASYKPSYPRERADERRPFILHTEKHLYKPGEEVKIEGSIWSSLIDQIGDLSSVKLNVTDNKGNMTLNQKEVQVNNDGAFATNFTLPQNAELGSYSIDAAINVEANVLDTLNADVKSKLETSARFEVVSSNAFSVKAEGKNFSVNISSNSTVRDVEFEQQEKKISFHVEGQTGTMGITQITIPKSLLSGQMTVSIDGKVIPPESSDVVTIADTEEGMTLEINYHHSEHTIEVSGTNVVPEFPLSIIVMAGAISAVIVVTTMMARKRSVLT